MNKTHRNERKPSPDTSSSSDTPSDTDSDSSTDPPRKPYVQRLREEVDRQVRTKNLEATGISEGEAREGVKRGKWLPKHQQQVPQGPKPRRKGNANAPPPNNLEEREHHAIGDKLKASTNPEWRSTGSSIKSSSWSSIAPRLSAELALKTCLAEFIETVDMYYSIDQLYDTSKSYSPAIYIPASVIFKDQPDIDARLTPPIQLALPGKSIMYTASKAFLPLLGT